MKRILALIFMMYVAGELEARPSKRPLKEESCETEFVYSVSQFFRRLAESDDFLEVLEICFSFQGSFPNH